jgi:hypothetical protein
MMMMMGQMMSVTIVPLHPMQINLILIQMDRGMHVTQVCTYLTLCNILSFYSPRWTYLDTPLSRHILLSLERISYQGAVTVPQICKGKCQNFLLSSYKWKGQPSLDPDGQKWISMEIHMDQTWSILVHKIQFGSWTKRI